MEPSLKVTELVNLMLCKNNEKYTFTLSSVQHHLLNCSFVQYFYALSFYEVQEN